MSRPAFVQHVETQDLKIFVFTTCGIRPLPGLGMQELIREGSWRYWNHRCMQTSARYTHATDDGLRRAIETLAQRQKQTDAKVPTVREQRPLLAAVNY